jgi:hypothetical protein
MPMHVNLKAFAVGVAAALLLGTAAYAECEPGARIDGTTAEQARQKMQKAGYTQVRDLKKGCDSVWHGIAMKGGVPVRVLVTPQNVVMEEND